MKYLLLILLMACHNAPRPTARDNIAFDKTVRAWVGAGLRGSRACLKDVRVNHHKTQKSYNKVKGCGKDGSAGCTVWDSPGPGSKWRVTIHIGPKYGDDMGLVQHEALHILTYCYLSRNKADSTDRGHTDPRVWEATGGVESVQNMARQ